MFIWRAAQPNHIACMRHRRRRHRHNEVDRPEWLIEPFYLACPPIDIDQAAHVPAGARTPPEASPGPAASGTLLADPEPFYLFYKPYNVNCFKPEPPLKQEKREAAACAASSASAAAASPRPASAYKAWSASILKPQAPNKPLMQQT